MKALEPTFQIAQYSNRCYEKVSRIFQIEREKGKEVKQSVSVNGWGLIVSQGYMQSPHNTV